MRRVMAAIAAIFVLAPRADAGGLAAFACDPGGRIRAVRTADVDGDGRLDLVLLVDTKHEDAASTTDLVVMRTPATPDPATYFPASAVTRVPCSGPSAGVRGRAGAVAVGRFGEKGHVLFRFLGPDGLDDQAIDGSPAPAPGSPDPAARPKAPPTLLGRSEGLALVFWDAVADLDGDGRDECWFPTADGHMVVRGGAAASDATLDLNVGNAASSGGADLVQRAAYVPTLVAADVDGDGKKELVGLVGTDLTVWRREGAAMKVVGRVALPFLVPDPKRPPEEIRAPRISLADVDGDGKVDLLVTLVQGRSDRVGGLKTSLFFYSDPLAGYAAPLAAGGTTALSPPMSRLDTESVALHPRFVDVDGDGKLDYVGDSVRGTLTDLVKNATGGDPDITYTVFRFDPEKGAYETTPYATFLRPYSGAESRGNKFGRCGFLEGDFDGDGRADFLDLGNLAGFEVLKGVPSEGVAAGGRVAFTEPILAKVKVPNGLVADALVVDLDGDKVSEAIVWSDDRLFVISSKGAR